MAEMNTAGEQMDDLLGQPSGGEERGRTRNRSMASMLSDDEIEPPRPYQIANGVQGVTDGEGDGDVEDNATGGGAEKQRMPRGRKPAISKTIQELKNQARGTKRASSTSSESPRRSVRQKEVREEDERKKQLPRLRSQAQRGQALKAKNFQTMTKRAVSLREKAKAGLRGGQAKKSIRKQPKQQIKKATKGKEEYAEAISGREARAIDKKAMKVYLPVA